MRYIGDTFYKRSELLQFGFKYLGENVKIKKNVGIYFCENIEISDNVRIDDFTIIVGSGAGLSIGKNVHISAKGYFVCFGGINLEAYTTFGPNVSLFSASDDYTEGFLGNGTVDDSYKKLEVNKVTIKKGSIIGANSTILPGCTMNFASSLGAHSLLKSNTDRYDIFGGVPAKKIGKRKEFNKEILELLNE
jgi:galactoside O-acetyltransferase